MTCQSLLSTSALNKSMILIDNIYENRSKQFLSTAVGHSSCLNRQWDGRNDSDALQTNPNRRPPLKMRLLRLSHLTQRTTSSAYAVTQVHTCVCRRPNNKQPLKCIFFFFFVSSTSLRMINQHILNMAVVDKANIYCWPQRNPNSCGRSVFLWVATWLSIHSDTSWNPFMAERF